MARTPPDTWILLCYDFTKFFNFSRDSEGDICNRTDNEFVYFLEITDVLVRLFQCSEVEFDPHVSRIRIFLFLPTENVSGFPLVLIFQRYEAKTRALRGCVDFIVILLSFTFIVAVHRENRGFVYCIGILLSFTLVFFRVIRAALLLSNLSI